MTQKGYIQNYKPLMYNRESERIASEKTEGKECPKKVNKTLILTSVSPHNQPTP